jgi:hypothetical protein
MKLMMMKKIDMIGFGSVLFYVIFFIWCYFFSLSKSILLSFVIAAVFLGAAGFYTFAKGD